MSKDYLEAIGSLLSVALLKFPVLSIERTLRTIQTAAEALPDWLPL